MAIRRTQRLLESLSTTASGMTGPREGRETLTGAEEMTALTDETDAQRGARMMRGASRASDCTERVASYAQRLFVIFSQKPPDTFSSAGMPCQSGACTVTEAPGQTEAAMVTGVAVAETAMRGETLQVQTWRPPALCDMENHCMYLCML